MMIVVVVGRLLLVMVIIIYSSSIPVFPGAKGFGTHTVGGSGRHLLPYSLINTTVFHITNLNKDGKGSLKECTTSTIGPRVCIFDVSGVIDINGRLYVNQPYCTIAGQTAPKGGITLKRTVVHITASNVLIQHIFIRSGEKTDVPPDELDVLQVGSPSRWVENVVLDHVSLAYGVDEIVGTWYRNRNVTFSYLFVTHALSESIHGEGNHGKGIFIGPGSVGISIHHCLSAHNWDRNPNLGGGTSATNEQKHTATNWEVVNNLIYNWRADWSCINTNYNDLSDSTRPHFGHIIGNYFQKGSDFNPSSIGYNMQISGSRPPLPGSKFFIKDNIGPLRTSDSDDDWEIVIGDKVSFRHDNYVFPPAISTYTTAKEAKEEVLTNAGARPLERGYVDHEDLICVNDVRNNEGMQINCVEEDSSNPKCDKNAGGFANYPMKRHTLDVPSEYWIVEKNGYTRLENWLFGVTSDVDDTNDYECLQKCPRNSICIKDYCVCIGNGEVDTESCPMTKAEKTVISIAIISGVSITLLILLIIIILVVLIVIKKKIKKDGKEALINITSTEEFNPSSTSEIEKSTVSEN